MSQKLYTSAEMTLTSIVDGVGISSRTMRYKRNNLSSGVSRPANDNDWSTTPPITTTSERYLWSYEILTFTDGHIDRTTPAVIGIHGETGLVGATGRGIQSQTITYALGDSGETEPLAWLPTVPPPVEGKYQWTRTYTVYTDNQDPTTAYNVSYLPTNGQRGTGVVSSTVKYAQTENGIDTPEDWVDDPPAPEKGFYLWTKTHIQYSDNTSSTAYSRSYEAKDGEVGDQGPKGDDGIVGILTNENHAIPTDADGNYANYTGANTELVIYKGITRDTDNWEITIKADPDITGHKLADNQYVVTGLDTDVAEVTFTAEKAGHADIVKVFTVSKSKQGIAGEDPILYYLDVDTQYIRYNVETFEMTPATIEIEAKQQKSGTESEAQGYFVVYEQTETTSIDDFSGLVYAVQYESTSPESFLNYEIKSHETLAVKIEWYQDSMLTHLLDRETIPVISNGVSLKDIVNYYLASTASSGITLDNKNQFTKTMQTTNTTKRYLWRYEEQIFTDGRVSYTDPVVIGVHGEKGEEGEVGRSISSIEEYYLVSPLETGVVRTSGEWKPSVQTTSPTNKYLWNYEKINWNKAPLVTYVEPRIIGTHGERGLQGPAGGDAYTVILSNESHTFKGDVSNALADTIQVKVIAYKGATQVAADIGKITGQVDGLTTSIPTNTNNTTNAQFNVKVTTALTTPSGQLTIPITVDGKSFTKNFSFSVAFKGQTGGQGGKGDPGLNAQIITLSSSAQIITKDKSGGITPASIKVTGAGQNITIASWTYSTNGSTSFVKGLPDGFKQSGNTVTINSSEVTARTVAIKASNGAVEDVLTIARVEDGSQGAKGDPGPQGIQGPQGATGARGPQGNTGTSVTSVTEHYLATSASTGVTTATEGWTTAVQGMTSTNKYLWNYEQINFSDGTTQPTLPVVIGVYGDTGAKGGTGATGATGRSITSITEHYLVTSANSEITRATSGWSTSMKTTTPTNKYLWNYETINWSSGTTPTYVEPIIIGVHGDKGETGPQGATGSRGPKGDVGTSVSSITEYYLATASASGVTTETSGWTTTIQNMDATKKYLWNYEKVNFSDGKNQPTIPVIIGVYGDKGQTGSTGATGRSITGITEHYLASNSATGVTRSTSGWSTSMQQTSPEKRYLWNYETVTWSSGTSPTYVEPIVIGVHGEQGPQGIQGPKGATGSQGPQGNVGVGVTSITEHYLATTASSGVTTATSGWTTAIQTIDATKKYLWNYEKINFSDGTNQPTIPVIIGVYGDKGATGSTGPTGRSITGITEHYLATSSATGVTRSTSDWKTTMQTTTPTNKYLWNYETITWSSGTSPTYVDPIIIGIHGEQGPQGPQGIQGAKGATGSQGPTGATGTSVTSVTEYYLATSESSGILSTDTRFTTTMQSMTATNKYLWNYEKINFSNNTSQPTIPVIIGVYGDKGQTGSTGATGRSITSITEHYLATSASTGVTRSTSGWGTTMKTTTETNKYLWNYETINWSSGTTPTYVEPIIIGIHGAQGPQGIQGPQGAKGATGERGPQGNTGTSVSTITEYYLATSAATGVTTGTAGWTTTMQPMDTTKKYLWNYELIKFSDNSTQPTIPVIIGVHGSTGEKGATGGTGATGATGRSITSITEHYLATSAASGVTRSTSGWKTTMQGTTTTNKYLWNYETINWSSGTTPTYVEPIIIGVHGETGAKGETGSTGATGATGAQGVSITKVDVQYYLSTSNTSQAGGSWSTTAPAWVDGRYMWSKTVTTYSSGTPTESKPVCITGAKGSTGSTGATGGTGATGRGISSIVEQFYLSDSKTVEPPTSGWLTNPPTWSPGKYIWTRSLITYTTGTPTTSTTKPLVSSEWEAINEIEIGGRNLLKGTSNEWAQLVRPEGNYFWEQGTDVQLEAGETYTFSVVVEKVSDDTVPINLHIGLGSSPNTYSYDVGSWRLNSIPFGQKVVLTQKITTSHTNNGARTYFAWRLRNERLATTIRFKEAKLEKGNMATDWTPAPEDIQGDVQGVRERMSEAEAALSQMTGTIEDISGNISELSAANYMTSSEYHDSLRQELASFEADINLGPIRTTTDAIDQNFTFSDLGMIVGSDSQKSKVRVANDRIEMINENKVASYIVGGTMYADNFVALQGITLLNHTVTSENNKTVFRYQENE